MTRFGTKRFQILETPGPRPTPYLAWIKNAGQNTTRIFLFGGATGKLPGSSNPGPWTLSITKDGSRPWVTQLYTPAPSIGGYVSQNELALIQAEITPYHIKITAVSQELGSVIGEDRPHISQPTYELTHVEPSQSSAVIATRLSPTLYRVNRGQVDLFWNPSNIPLPANFPSHYRYHSSRVYDFVSDSFGRTFVILEAQAVADPRSPRPFFISIVCLSPSGQIVWGPLSYGEPLARYWAGRIIAGADGCIYAVYSMMDRVSRRTDTVLRSFWPDDGSENFRGWPKILSKVSKWTASHLTSDNHKIYVAWEENPLGSEMLMPKVTSFDYLGNESAISLTEYGQPDENWITQNVIANNESFFLAGLVIRNTHTPAETQELVIRKYDMYGIEE
jgi:hypothetical protein